MANLRAMAGITFLYYDALDAPTEFYENILGLELVDDQHWAKIYRIRGNAYLGIVDGRKGFHRAQENNAVLVTFVVHDVEAWYNRLVSHGVRIRREIETHTDIHVRCFFAEDPGGYAIEVQTFLNPSMAKVFGL